MLKNSIHPTAQQGFSNTQYAQNYQHARPDYPEEISHWLQQHLEDIVKDMLGKAGQDEIAFPYITHVYHFRAVD